MVADEIYQQYTWMVVLGAFFAFFSAFGIGANDVANAFATSVGSKAITIRQAMYIASVMEFAGAVLLGGQVSETIRKGISDPDCFQDKPAVLMWGMVSVVFAVGVWLLLATFLELPVSTTHSCVGCVIGMTMVAAGSGCVTWYKPSSTFPFMKGVTSIVLSWVFSPVLSGIISSFFFYFTRMFVLRNENSTERAILFYPLLVAFTVCMCLFYIIIKGAKGVNKLWGFDAGGDDFWATCIMSFVGGIVAAGLSLFLRPMIRRSVDETSEEDEAAKPDAAVVVGADDEPEQKGALAWIRKMLDTDTVTVVREDATTSDIHARAEKFSNKTEAVFRYMQILTASFDSFAHGANDVANAMGPFTAVWFIYDNSGKFAAKNDIGLDIYWILALGGLGIVVGLGVYGYKIMFALGLKLCKVTPSRGFAIELGSMFVILLGSRFGIPLSTTHCQVGATIGVSLLETSYKSTNWWIVGKAVLGWVLTMVIAGGICAVVFSIGYASIQFDDSQVLGKGWQGN